MKSKMLLGSIAAAALTMPSAAFGGPIIPLPHDIGSLAQELELRSFQNDPFRIDQAISDVKVLRNKIASDLTAAQQRLSRAQSVSQRVLVQAQISILRFRLNRADSLIRKLNNWLSELMRNGITL